jgi:hypothetical protein
MRTSEREGQEKAAARESDREILFAIALGRRQLHSRSVRRAPRQLIALQNGSMGGVENESRLSEHEKSSR